MPAAPAQPFNQRIRIWGMRGLALLLLPALMFTRPAWGLEHGLTQVLGIVGIYLVVAAILGRFWAILYIGGRKNREVVQVGPYSICRHPLYLFSTIGAAGLGLMLGSFLLAVLLAAAVGAGLSATARWEEAWLAQDLGADWPAYAAHVPRIWPRLSGFRTPDRFEVSVPSLKRNLADAVGFLLLIPAAALLNAGKLAGWWPTWPLW